MSGIDKTAAWKALQAHYAARRGVPLRQLFAEDGRRFEKFSLSLDDLLLDFSKTSLNADTVALLCNLAEQAEVSARRDAMFAGEAVNASEAQAALHVALRAGAADDFTCAGKSLMPPIIAARRAMLDFAEDCRCGHLTGGGDEAFSDVVNIGIGGSDLGPAMAVAALRPYHDGPRLHFVSNMDGAHLVDTLAGLVARRTLILISSKTFTTAETMHNARRAREWLAAGVGEANTEKHLVAMTAAPARAQAFGVPRIFSYGDWVGGRYSLWGAVGLPLALAIGKERFLEFLDGARGMDEHFLQAPPAKNLPLMFGLLGVWHRNFCAYPTRAVLPYAQRLHLLPAYLQQLDMESNGKHVLQNGEAATTATAPVVWGTAASNAQHAYFQMLHQGTDIVPGEFIVAAQGHETDDERQKLLVGNCLAQSAALCFGEESANNPPHRHFAGGRPSVTLLCRQFTPYSLGRLLALFEHRTFVEGAIWGVNSFDQWGVELGKTLAARLHKTLAEERPAEHEDSSTQGLIQHWRRLAGGK